MTTTQPPLSPAFAGEPAPKRKPELSESEQIVAFLEKWIAVRAGQVSKYELRTERAKGHPKMGQVYASEMRTLQHFSHEKRMLERLLELVHFFGQISGTDGRALDLTDLGKYLQAGALIPRDWDPARFAAELEAFPERAEAPE